jgi:hypothetical protein
MGFGRVVLSDNFHYLCHCYMTQNKEYEQEKRKKDGK